MSTARIVVNGALARVRNTDSTEQPTAEDSSMALTALNQLFAGLKTQNIDVGWTTLANVNADLPTGEEHDEGLIAMLAKRITDELGKQVTAQLRLDAIAGRNGLVAAYWIQDGMRADRALANMPSQRHLGLAYGANRSNN